jgi:hypothetical protein
VLADDSTVDPIAVEIAAPRHAHRRTHPAERQLAAARILARGSTPYLISKRLHVNGTTALMLAARCQDVTSWPYDEYTSIVAEDWRQHRPPGTQGWR